MAATSSDVDGFVEPPQGGRFTLFGCPDCRGVLAVSELGSGGYLRFACHVGHIYSEETLLDRKEAEFEECLWSAAETSNELALLKAHLAARAQGINLESATRLAVSAEQSQQDRVKLRAILERRGAKGVRSDE